MHDLKIALVQFDISWENSLENLQKLSALISNAPLADVYILPEMFNTGFSMNPTKIAEENEGPAHQWMRRISGDLSSMVCGSIATIENGLFYNRLRICIHGDDYGYYDKHNLFTLAGEEKKYSPGNEHLMIHYKGWKIIPLICYDLRFPLWCHNSQQADLMIFVANWPDTRINHWRILLPARAIENQCYIAAVNRCGLDGNGNSHQGSSMIIHPTGQVHTEIINEESISITNIQKKEVQDFRRQIGSLRESIKS